MMVKDKKHQKRILLAFRQEVALLWYLHDHPNIVKLVGFSEREMMIVMKFYSRGSLYSLIYNKAFPDLGNMKVTLVLDVCNALRILHQTGIVHNDLKPANVLLEDTDKKNRFRAVLADFGISHVVDNRITGVQKMVVQNVVGASTLYAAPEVLLRLKKLPTPLSPRVARGGDLFSFGMVMFEVLNRKLYDMTASKKPTAAPK
jgi:serine/threonine protein kinase